MPKPPDCGYCGDKECSECGGRPARGGPPLDEFMKSKAAPPKPTTPAAQPSATAFSPPVVQAPAPVQPTPAAPSPHTARELEIAELGGITMPAPKVGKPRAGSNPAFAAAYTAWQAQCVARKQWIEGFRVAHLQRVEQANAEIAKWKQYVADGKKAYDDALATEPPPAPRKEDFPAQ